MKLRIADSVFYYPDVMLVCADAIDDYYEVAPCVVIEVLSKSTYRIDMHEKRLAYMGLASLQLYLVVDSRQRNVIGYYRTVDGWEERHFSENEIIGIPCVDGKLTPEQIYAKSGY